MSTPFREHRNIGGTPYVLTWVPDETAWRVNPAAPSPMERVCRTYAVYCTPDGGPLRCSCPDNHYRGRRCKHMREVRRIQYELNPTAALADARRLVDAAYHAGATAEDLLELRAELLDEMGAGNAQITPAAANV